MSLPILKEKISSNLRGFFSKFNVLPFIVEIKNNDLQSVINEATGYQINVRQTIPTFGMFSAEATPETIFELTKLREVAYIHFDAPKIQFSTPAQRDDALFRALDIGTRLLPQTTIPGPNFNVNVPTPQGVENFTTLVDNMLAKLFTPKGLPKFPFPEPPKPPFFDKFPDFPKPPLPFMDTEIRGDELLFGKHPVSKGEFFSTAYTRKLLGIDIAEENGFTGRGVKVSVVDTGIDEDAYQVHGVDFSNVIPGHPDVDENGHGCLSPDGLVYTTMCGIEPIGHLYERLNLPETHLETGSIKHLEAPQYTIGLKDNKWQKVRISHLHKIPINGKIIHIKTPSGEFKLTPHHPTMVIENGKYMYKRADELRNGDVIARPDSFVDMNFDYQKVEYGIYIECPNCKRPLSAIKNYSDIKRCCENGCGQTTVFNKKTYLTVLDEDWAYLIGLIITDGHITSQVKTETQFTSETPELINKFVELCNKKGFKTQIYYHKDRCPYVSVYSKRFRDLMIKIGIPSGNKSKIVELPSIIGKSPKSVIEAFIAGVIDGDGHVDNNRPRIRISTGSKIFADQFSFLLGILGIRAPAIIQKDNCYQITIPQNIQLKKLNLPYLTHPIKKERFDKYYNNESVLQSQNRISKIYELKPNKVTSIEVKQYNGYFYDFTTESENYVAGNFGIGLIHNTWCSTCVYGSAEINNYNIFVKGMAPDVDAIAIKVLGGGIGTGRESDVIKGMELSYHKGAKIVSMSLGSETCNGTGPDPSTTCPECRVVKALTDIGMIFVIAAGNCLIGETLISTPKGCIPIKELQKNDLVYTYNKNPENFPKIYIKELFSNEKQLLASDDRNIFSEAIPEAKKILNLFNNGKQDVFELKTRTRTIQCTNNHPFLSIRVSKDENKQTYNSKYITEWKQLHELKSNDIIVINKKLIDIETKHKISINEMMIFGCFIGDGWLRFRERNRSEIGFCLPEYSNPEIRNKYIDLIKEVYDYKIKSNKHQIYIYNLNIAKRFSDLGFNKKAKEKHIPNWIWECNHEQKIAFLEGYIDSDGTKQKDGNISFCSPNKKLIEEIRMLCIDVGFRCTNLLLRTRDISINNGKKDYNYKKYKTYEFRLTNYSTNWKRKYSYNQLKDFRIENEYFGFEKIISIKYIGIKEVYDIEVENEHNFIANGIVVHNSGPKAQTIGCPGSSPDCISVGAISPKDNSVADFSSRGPIYGRIKPDIASYGVDIYSATSRGALLDPSGDKIIDGYTSMSGTSMATPHIAGLLTLVVEKYPDITAPQIKEIFRAKGLPKNPHTGWGIANWSWF